MTQELCEAVASSPSIVVRGGSTKSGLGAGRRPAHELDISRLAGIVTYDPSEFLITARAGTRIATLVGALAENGQYMPFDPVLVNAHAPDRGATLGGTIASGISGANRLLYGSLRDFVMEVELIDGLGRLVRGGGKVVKNSAGFDLPKLMVGSYGRLGALTEATLKVFPQPPAFLTQSFEFASMASALEAMQKLQTNPLPISALEIEPAIRLPACRLTARYAGRPEALAIVAARSEQLLGRAGATENSPLLEADYWKALSEFAFVPPQCSLLRISMSGRKLLAVWQALESILGIASVRYSGGANVAWVSLERVCDYEKLDRKLSALNVAAIIVRNPVDPPEATEGLRLLGDKSWLAFSDRIQLAMDPQRKFARFENSELRTLVESSWP